MIPRPNEYSVRSNQLEKLNDADVLLLLERCHRGTLAKEAFAAELRTLIKFDITARGLEVGAIGLGGWVDLFESIAEGDTFGTATWANAISQDRASFVALIKRKVTTRLAKEIESLDSKQVRLDFLETSPGKKPRNQVSLTESYLNTVATELTNAVVEFEKLAQSEQSASADSGLLKTVLDGLRAKERLTEAFLPIIEKQIAIRLREGNTIGIYDRSEAFAHIAAHIYKEMSGAAKASIERNAKLSNCIAVRVSRRMVDIRRKNMAAAKRTTHLDTSDDKNTLAGDDEKALHRMIRQNAFEELYNALDQLPELERLVVLSSYGLESDETVRYVPGERLNMKAVAAQLGISEAKGRKAFRRGMYRLVKGLGSDDSLNPFD